MILLIDNYDSFTYNLYHYVTQVSNDEVLVKRNDKISISDIKKLNPKAIILSPGPCSPDESGICLQVINDLKGQYPIFGVCLGHQAIAQAFGGVITKTYPMHGKVSEIYHNNLGVFENIPSPFNATRYHSLTIKKEALPQDIEVTAHTLDGTIMGIKHKTLNIEGVQFHPESIASQYGHELIKNFINNC
jgi:anthranilate synthase/aminodeoxychorismate synthase-like glutamine amidotransferase